MPSLTRRPLVCIALTYGMGAALPHEVLALLPAWLLPGLLLMGGLVLRRGQSLWQIWVCVSALMLGGVSTTKGPQDLDSTWSVGKRAVEAPVIATLLEPPRLSSKGWRARAVASFTHQPERSGPVLLHGQGPLPGWGRGHRVATRVHLTVLRSRGNPGERWRTAPMAIARIPEHRPVVPLLSHEAPSPTGSARSRLVDAIQRRASSSGAAITLALALGESGGLPQSLRDLFRSTGTSHLLAISGLHLALVAFMVFALLCRAMRASRTLHSRGDGVRLSAAVTLLAVLSYGEVTGWQIATVRASWMVALGCLGIILRLQSDGPSCLALAVLGSLASAPERVHSPGFQLSVAAVAALLTSAAALQRRRNQSPLLSTGLQPPPSLQWRFARATAWSSTVAWLATAPLVAFHFGVVSWGAPLLNIVVVPLVGLILLPCALFATACTALSPTLGELPLQGTDLVCKILVELLHTLQPLALHTPVRPLSSLTCTALLCATFCALLSPLQLKRSVGGIALCLALAWTGSPPTPATETSLRVTFLNVGHGDAILIRTRDDRAMLVDGGGHHGARVDPIGTRVVVPALHALGVKRLDVVVLTHPDADHLGGLLAVTQHFPVGEFWWNGRIENQPTLLALLAQLSMQGTRLVPVDAAHPPQLWGDTVLEFLGPPPGAHKSGEYTRNDASVVLRIAQGAVSFLLTGDIEGVGESALLSSGRLTPTTVVKAPHHGSPTSSSPRLLDVLRAAHAVVSCGDKGQYNLPSVDVVARYTARGAAIHRTDRHGAIHFATDGVRLSVRHGGRGERP